MKDQLLPTIYSVRSLKHETADTFNLTLQKEEDSAGALWFRPGQFNMLYQFGFGEVAISLSGSPYDTGYAVHTIRAVGSVTQSLEKLKRGDCIGVRGPYGTSWPLGTGIQPCDVLIIGGGVGLAPLRSAIYYMVKNRTHYRNITLLYGARTPNDILYRKEMPEWKKAGFAIQVTVDKADPGWTGNVGVVPSLVRRHVQDSENTLVLICGPEIMIKFSLHELMRANINEENIYIAMERNMNCAVGFCGHCQFGPYFLCKDGPIFPYSKLKSWLTIKEL